MGDIDMMTFDKIVTHEISRECNDVIIDILKHRLPTVVNALELPDGATEFDYFVKLIQIEPGDEFIKVVFTTDFNARDYVWYFRARID